MMSQRENATLIPPQTIFSHLVDPPVVFTRRRSTRSLISCINKTLRKRTADGVIYRTANEKYGDNNSGYGDSDSPHG